MLQAKSHDLVGMFVYVLGPGLTIKQQHWRDCIVKVTAVLPLRVSVQSSWDGQKMKSASISSRGLSLCDMFRELTCEEMELNTSIMNWFDKNKRTNFKRDRCTRRKTSRTTMMGPRPRQRMDKKPRKESRSGRAQ